MRTKKITSFFTKETTTVNPEFYNIILEIITEIKDTINYQRHYRNFIFTVEWGKNPATTFKENFSKNRITELLEKDFLLSSDMILNAIDIDHLNSSSKEIVVNLSYAIPETTYSTEIELSLNESGDFTVQPKL